MPPDALALALAAAFLHVGWNLLLAGSRDTLAATGVAVISSVVVAAPVAAATWEVEAAALPYVAGSSALELAYFFVGPARLRAAFGPGPVLAGIAGFAAYAFVLAALDLAPAAPVAAVRETSVVIAVALAAVLLRERVRPGRRAGAVVVAAGVAVLSF